MRNVRDVTAVTPPPHCLPRTRRRDGNTRAMAARATSRAVLQNMPALLTRVEDRTPSILGLVATHLAASAVSGANRGAIRLA